MAGVLDIFMVLCDLVHVKCLFDIVLIFVSGNQATPEHLSEPTNQLSVFSIQSQQLSQWFHCYHFYQTKITNFGIIICFNSKEFFYRQQQLTTLFVNNSMVLKNLPQYLSRLIFKNKWKFELFLIQYSIMGNQNCSWSQTSRNSIQILTSPNKQACKSPSHNKPTHALVSENAPEEMDQYSPINKYEIRFLKASLKASDSKKKQKKQSKQIDISPPQIKCLTTKNTFQKNLNTSVELGGKLSKSQAQSKGPVNQFLFKGHRNLISILAQQYSSTIDLKITGESFYKIKQQSIAPYYQITTKIGEGSFGSVYKGRCLVTNELRAIKILKKKIMNESDERSLLSQINILKKMDHINIIKLYDVFFHKNFFYVVTQFCQGGSLLEALQRQQIKSEKDVMLLMKQILSAVCYMHQMKVAHRDLKLDNIVLVNEINKQNGKACVKLIDFGLAQEIQNNLKTKTGLVGTISYMAPQIFSGYFSTQSDVWSCGIILCMLLIGFNPFKRKKQSFTINAIQNEEINFAEREWHRVSAKAKSLAVQMLEKSTEKRINLDKALNNQWFKLLSSVKQKVDRSSTATEKAQIVISNFNNYHRGNNFICYVKNFLISRQLTQAMRQEMALIFEKIDSDSSGVIQKQELIELYKLVSGITNEEIQKLVEKIDQNKSGRIDFHQFLVCMTKNQMIRNEHCINQAFDFFDEDKTGYIERDELFECLDGCEEDQVVKILKVADFNGDGKISRNQFLEYLTNVQI